MAGPGGDMTPRSAVVVGAGIVGLSTAWFLQDRGVHVTVVERDEVGAGASWGNAGWLSPGLAMPLTSPHVLAEGLHGLADRRAPLSIPVRPDPRLWGFLLRFAAHCRTRYWRQAVQDYLPLLTESLPAFDTLAAEGVEVAAHDASVVAGFGTKRASDGLVRELALVRRLGVPVSFDDLDRDELRTLRPQLSDRAIAGVRLDGQRFVDPGRLLDGLALSVVSRGATVRPRFTVSSITADRGRIAVFPEEGPPVTADVAVVATGARLDDLVRSPGVRTRVRAGRGYSFSVPTDAPVTGPIYLPGVRVACTPYRGQLRVAGTMEFRASDDPMDVKRVDAIVDSARPLLTGVRWDERSRPRVGSRPVTADALPVLGATRQPGVFVAGGHGMWGVTLGPVTGRLLAEQITTGKQPAELIPFDPLR
ncbi:NAD(P)/FAD-dependent oxidoreductase [Actinomycetospora chibensis]|uniref:NAD(P)/FAD-dependent oxidoreductase n=1 Tax=Actinomycetospora chibensis TaxID=663606 RepID=A0ABV9RMQ5_9PSEU|nr:FAD-dependent oxidoreductase [Actinomycetospora chibensis]MDD7927751.1 FAD-dependent oxidoreductase [Actinomycetospora chibensis]